MSNLFESKEWFGEFFSDQYEKRFPAKVSYSPEKGVVLDYTITGHKVIPESRTLCGNLNSGEKCTLFGYFNPQRAGGRLQGGFATMFGKNRFSYLVVGDYVTDDDIFHEVIFTLTTMQEFFFPKGYKDLEKYVDKPLFKTKAPYGSIEIGNSATFGFLNKDVTSQIYSRNSVALEELKKSFSEIGNRHPDSFFMLKKDIGYYIRLKINNGCNIKDIYRHINEIANLFAVLTFSPIYPESILILIKDDNDARRTLDVYPSLVIEKRTIDLAMKEKSHFNMPITKDSIDLPKVIGVWLTTSCNYSTIISSIQHETNFRDEHSVHGEIVLYSSQLESISYSAGISGNDKYEYPINTHGADTVKDVLNKIFKEINSKALGKNIGDLRNEIAHVEKPKQLLEKLSMIDLICIGHCLQLIVIAYILTSLGITHEIIENYQHKFTPYVNNRY